ncbi:MAG: coproporphyrinogen-III oxidase family protein [Thermotogota bacterium]
MFHKRYRSHHDSEHALKKLLNTTPHIVPKDDLIKVLGTSPEKDDRVLYCHVPYCDKICSFCNLNRKFCGDAQSKKNQTLTDYTDYICSQIESFSDYSYISEKPFKTVYFGGGTPTVLKTSQLSRIIETIHRHLTLTDNCEFTMESTLHNLDDEKIARLKELGVNRFSIGIQTFNDAGRQVMGRTFDQSETVKRLSDIRKLFDQTLCIDIIYSYPGQTIGNIYNDVQLLLNCQVDSVSFYSLMLHEGSVLNKQIENGEVVFDRTLESDRTYHNTFYEALITKGFERLELSKLVKPGRDEYRYIKLKYLNADVLPIGVGAGGRLGNISIYNMAPHKNMYTLTNPEFDFFHEMLGRMQYGIYDLVWYKDNLTPEAYDGFMKQFVSLFEERFFNEESDGLFTLTTDGVFWGNNIAVELLKSMIQSIK